MERVFSVDDILGTFWKLENQGDGVQPTQMSHFGSQVDLQKYYREQSASTPYSTSMAHSTSFQQMNRSSSEWAFQEFLKTNSSPKGDASGEVQGEKEKDENNDDSDSPKSNSKNDDENVSKSADVSATGQSHEILNSGSKDKSSVLTSDPQPLNTVNSVLSYPNQGDDVSQSGAEAAVAKPLFEIPSDGRYPDPDEYAHILKQNLDKACAIAKTRVIPVNPESDSGPVLSRPQAMPGMNYPLLPPFPMNYFPPYSQFQGGLAMPEGGIHHFQQLPPSQILMPPIPPSSAIPQPNLNSNSQGVAQNRQVNSTAAGVSSREHSDEDDVKSEGENELMASLEHVTDPDEIKRIKRMLSNRESARRSRRRKQAHLSILETEVTSLKAENSELVERLSEIGKKYSEAAVDNRVLKSDVEALRAKVKMAEEMLNRSHHLTQYLYPPQFPPPEIPSASDPPYYHPRALRPGQLPTPVSGPPPGSGLPPHFLLPPHHAMSMGPMADMAAHHQARYGPRPVDIHDVYGTVGATAMSMAGSDGAGPGGGYFRIERPSAGFERMSKRARVEEYESGDGGEGNEGDREENGSA